MPMPSDHLVVLTKRTYTTCAVTIGLLLLTACDRQPTSVPFTASQPTASQAGDAGLSAGTRPAPVGEPATRALATTGIGAATDSVAAEPLPVVTGTNDAPAVVDDITLFVGPEREPCPGLTAQPCLVVATNPGDPYAPWFGTIEGFDFESGFTYELRVRRTIPAGSTGGDAVWRLAEVVHKDPVPGSENVVRFENVRWRLVVVRDASGDRQRPPEDAEVTLEAADGRVSGSSGCNTYFGTYDRDDTYVSVNVEAVTQAMCQDDTMVLEGAFLRALASVDSYLIVGAQLQLSNAAGVPVLTLRAPRAP